MSAVAARPATTRMTRLIDREAANVKSPCSKTKRGYLKRNSNSQPMGAPVQESAHSTSDGSIFGQAEAAGGRERYEARDLGSGKRLFPGPAPSAEGNCFHSLANVTTAAA